MLWCVCEFRKHLWPELGRLEAVDTDLPFLYMKRPESLQQNICGYIAWILRLCISSEETTSLATVGAPSTEHSMRPEWGLRGSVAFV